MYSQIALDDGRTFTHLAQIFDRGLKVAGPNAPFIGHRPMISANPLKFADYFIWSTWGEVARRRIDVGSGIENLFRSGYAVRANGLETVGLWSANIPGEFAFHMYLSFAVSIAQHMSITCSLTIEFTHTRVPLRHPSPLTRVLILQNGGFLISPSRCTERS